MWSFREIKERGYIPQRTLIKLFAAGAGNVLKLFIRNPGDVKKLKSMDNFDGKYVRPSREYDIPKFSSNMKFFKSNERYLRPTLWCDCGAPEVIAVANKLGAFEKSDHEFAESAFHFVKEKMSLEILSLNPVEDTFRRGTGTCFHLITAFIALCRAAGIKARYKMFAMNMIQAWVDSTVGVDPTVKKWYDSMGYFMLEGEGEAFIDGKWVVAHVGPKAERQAFNGIPITKFGEDSIGVWFFPIRDTIMTMESIPYGLGAMVKLGKLIAPGSMERVNISIQKQIEEGRRIIEKAGGCDAYDQSIRKKSGPKSPKIKIEGRKEIIFDK